MKQVFTKIVTITLAFLVLFSTFSFTVAKHYCGDFLVDVSYVGEAGSCNKDKKDDCGTVIKKKKCCKDEVSQIDGQDDLQKVTSEKISFKEAKFILSFCASSKLLFQSLEKQSLTHQYYSPPDLVLDIQVLHEVFII
ncbi:HYC_CC_PP family protein [Tenacibaculum retecalamus]|uniref:HYC_CC_PP family protein n=1 Tax=Tenacibaculum retecalamus TaxID=3018315 RepID=UPI0023D94178|nr:hypothetical protein [Tenacibaculum retecalamus]WBX70814.1 hypothetical protein PG912_11370 [Tenacibaculum retecalamus]